MTQLWQRRDRGFTLIEASLTMVIVGVAFVAAIELFAACAMQNRASSNMTVAMMLAQQTQEMMISLPFTDPNPISATFGPESGETLAGYDDIDDFNNLSISPPIDAARAQIAELNQYGQTITVTPVSINQPSASGGAGTAVRCTVTITYRPTPSANTEHVYAYSWLRLNQ